jgi:branched-subunit amino acid aminotransferase/4-amino-4-deoxychorismate lyase
MRLPSDDAPVWLNGEYLPASRAFLPLSDVAVQAGMGLFETVAVREGRLLDLVAHLTRLRDGAGRMRVPVPEEGALVPAMRKIAASVEGGCGWVKVIAGRTGTVAVFGGTMDPAEIGRPASAVLLRWRLSSRSPLAGLKSLNYAPYLLGAEEAARRGADEGIWCNARGHLAEGCTSNLVVVRQRKIFTPGPGDGMLPGTVRELALRAARELLYPVHEGKVRLKRLETADEAFLTSSLRDVRPLVRFQDRPVGNGRTGPVTRAIAERVDRLRIVDRPEAGPESASGG